MLKKSKEDKPKPQKFKPEKAEKGAAKGKGAAQKYFWEAWLEKRRKAKMPARESSLPKPVMSKEDKVKLLIAGAIVLLVPVVIILIGTFGGHPEAVKKP